MMANRPVSRTPHQIAACIIAGLLVAALASCAPPPRTEPAPPPSLPPPPSAPIAAPAPVPPGWMDAPITPGTWAWTMENGQSVARFAGGALVLRCDRAAGVVRMEQAASATTPVPVTIQTEALRRIMTATPQSSGGRNAVVTDLAARDPILDAMAFSRGRFAVLTAQEPALYVPSWPEVSRVIEDCR